jgi:hypothetical protein
MQGARSGKTQGTLSSGLADCCFENSGPTQEITIIGRNSKPFSRPGDSRAWVIESDRENGFVIGVVLGGYFNGIAYVSVITPMAHLLKEIETTLGIEFDASWCWKLCDPQPVRGPASPEGEANHASRAGPSLVTASVATVIFAPDGRTRTHWGFLRHPWQPLRMSRRIPERWVTAARGGHRRTDGTASWLSWLELG